MPITTTQIGVRELRMPASELSIFVMATANRKAGSKFPNTALRITRPSLFLGIFEK